MNLKLSCKVCSKSFQTNRSHKWWQIGKLSSWIIKYLSHCMQLRLPFQKLSRWRLLLKQKKLLRQVDRLMRVSLQHWYKSKILWLWFLTPMRKKKVKMLTGTVTLKLESLRKTQVYPGINKAIKEVKVWKNLEVSIAKVALRICASLTFWTKTFSLNA